MNIQNTGLVLEGGGMRGVFTSGVLDYFMDNNIQFPYTIGVSAGACNGLSYMSNQRGRAKACNIDLLEKYKYIGIWDWIKKGSIMDFDLLFKDFPYKIIPYDFNYYFNNPNRFVAVTSNCLTGEAEYFEEKKEEARLLDICQASCSLPFVCPVTYVDNIPMLDGGICDAIPIRKSIEEGYTKNMVVLTRNKGYRKSVSGKHLPKFIYRKYPAIRKRLEQKSEEYNAVMDFIEEKEQSGEIIVIRPTQKLEVGRLEKNPKKLTDLYLHGYECAKEVFLDQIQ